MRHAATKTAVLLGLLLVLSACAGGGGGSGEAASPSPSGSPAPSGSPTGTPAPSPTAGTSIEVAAVWTGAEEKSFKKVLDAFTKKTGIGVTYTPTGDNPAAVLGPRASGDEAPDVAILPQPGLMRDFHAQGFLVPLDDEVATTVEENYDETWRELGTIDGQLYGVFFKAANKSLIWFNTSVMKEAGAEPPQKWEQFDQVAQKLRPSGIPPLAVAGADGWTLTDWFENIYLETAGPEKYEQLASHEIAWDDQSVVDALDRMATLLTDEALVAKDTDEVLQTSFTESVEMPFRDPPEAAMVFEGDFAAGVISAVDAEPGKDADFAPFPSIEGDDPGVVVAGDIAVMMKDSDGAKQFLAFLASPEAGEIWAKEGGFISPNNGVAMDVYGDEIAKRAAQMIHDADTVAFDLSDRQPSSFGAQVGDGLYKLLQDVLRTPDQTDEIAAQLEERANEAYDLQQESASSGPTEEDTTSTPSESES